MKLLNSAKLTLPLVLGGIVGCTIVTRSHPNSTTSPPPPAPSTAATPAPAATAEPAPTAEPTAGGQPAPTASRPPSMPTPNLSGEDKGDASKPPTGLAARLSVKTPVVASDTLFGGPEKTEGALEGKVFLLPESTASLPNFQAMKPVTKLYTDQLDIASQDFKTGFPNATRRNEYFAIRYTGSFEVSVPGSYTFKLISDDGAKLHVDNAPIVNHDGRHEATEKLGFINLATGSHAITLDYFQADEKVALRLLVKGPDGQERPWAPKL